MNHWLSRAISSFVGMASTSSRRMIKGFLTVQDLRQGHLSLRPAAQYGCSILGIAPLPLSSKGLQPCPTVLCESKWCAM
jgi:acyl CoA:acetate/3-ketoacid CoA transferase alpha subunit